MRGYAILRAPTDTLWNTPNSTVVALTHGCLSDLLPALSNGIYVAISLQLSTVVPLARLQSYFMTTASSRTSHARDIYAEHQPRKDTNILYGNLT